MSTKKCACFTPSGLVYTRLETDGTIARRPGVFSKEINITRSRRSIDNDVYEPNTVDTILKENPSIGHLSFKNEPVNELENKNTKENIDKLIRETEAFLEAYERTKENLDHKRTKRRAQNWSHNKHKHKNDALDNSNESSLECKIEKDGNVNCSQVIYNDLKAWQTNRLSLEDQIRQLRTKLEDLKEIKRHLKTTKPVVEAQTMHSVYISNHLLNKTNVHEHNSSKEHFRKNRLHRLKPKHKNNTVIDKRVRQSNEYVIPTLVVKTKDDIFDTQLINQKTKTSASSEAELTTIRTAKQTNDSNMFSSELPKPQVTTVIIERNYLEQSNLNEEKITINPSSTTTASAHPSITEFVKSSQLITEDNKYEVTEKSSTSYFFHNAQHYNSAIDKILATEDPTVKISTETPSTSKPTIMPATIDILNLGPTRFDVSEYEQRNPNKGISKDDAGVFGQPVDVFQRRLHPLFIENEDKHVCYCEEGR